MELDMPASSSSSSSRKKKIVIAKIFVRELTNQKRFHSRNAADEEFLRLLSSIHDCRAAHSFKFAVPILSSSIYINHFPNEFGDESQKRSMATQPCARGSFHCQELAAKTR
jgi:hypothetical protein